MPKNKRQKHDLPDYNSGEEEEEEEEICCSLCQETTDDIVNFGKWIPFGKIRVHQLCCVGATIHFYHMNEQSDAYCLIYSIK